MLNKEGAQFNCKVGKLKVINKDGSFMSFATLKNGVYHVFPKFSNLRKSKNIKVNATIMKKKIVLPYGIPNSFILVLSLL